MSQSVPLLKLLGEVRGRMFSAQGQCNTRNAPLMAHVTHGAEAGSWVVHVGFGPSAHVNVLITETALRAVARAEAEEVPLYATGFLYGDARSEYVLDDRGFPLYDKQGQALVRAPVVVNGRFEGARLVSSDGHVRVDCAALLPFYLEFVVGF